jgi:P27 family predicted phage terminase small subunit
LPRKPRLELVGTGSEPGGTGAQPPRKLGKSGTDLWRRIQAEFNVVDSGGVELLMQACEAVDRVRQLSDQISADGLTVRTKQGMRSHPLLREETAIRGFIVRTLGKLGICDEQIKPTMGRPPSGFGWRGPHYDAD